MAAREDISLPVGGVDCAGWFYPPAGDDLGLTVVMAHGLSGVKEMRLDAYAERFAAIGCAVVVFDYRSFGASGGEPRQVLDIARQHEDWMAAVTYARTRTPASRLVLWGTSLSGGHVLALAGRVGADAVIAQVPHVSGPASVAAIPPLQSLRLTAHGLVDLARAAAGRSPHYVPAAGAPGTLAIMTAPEAAEMADLAPAGMAVDDRVAARFAVRIATYSPGRRLRGVRVPVLVQVADDDATTPPGPALKLGRLGAHVQVRRYPCGHFQPYVAPAFDTVVADQIAFLTGLAAGPAVTR